MRVALIAGFLALAAVTGGCSSGGETQAAAAGGATCPAAWARGWQKLADRIHAPVYCPRWMPSPLNAQIGGQFTDIDSVSRDRSYLISFISREDQGGGEVHVNLRGYPGRTKVPRCRDLDTNKLVPCFSDAIGTRRIAGFTVTRYTANQGADQWHVLYAWRAGGSLYAVSEHVTPPYTYAKVIANLERLLRSLVPIKPRA